VTAGALLRAAAGIVAGKRYTRRVESQLKQYFGVRYVFLTSSGKSALTLILKALKNLADRRQVVIPAYTCFSVPAAVIRAGLDVSICDIDPETFDFDYGCLEKTITRQTLCVVPTHLFGLPSDMTRVARLCDKDEVFVVEDAAQAMGGRYHDRLLGTLGDVGFFSLGRGKNITCGSGGIIVTNSDRLGRAIAREYDGVPDPTVAETVKDFLRLLLMRAFVHPRLFWVPKAIPWLGLGQTTYDVRFPVTRLSGVNVGALHGWQDRLWRTIRSRAETAAYFCAVLGLQALREASASPARLPVMMESRGARDRIYSLSEEQGLGLGVMYPTAINAIEELRAGFGGQNAPAAELVGERLLTIPTHHLLSEMDKRSICELLRQGLEQQVAA
jgi:dTDP-4-amino-4,6-dideoxygalactose transaminase